MKRNKFKDYIWFIAAVIFAVFLWEGVVYYRNEESTLLKVTLNVQNAAKAYVLNPEIKPKDAFSKLQPAEDGTEPSAGLKVVTYLYCIGIILAPFCTVSAVTMLVHKPAAYMVGLAKKKRPEEILIIGEGDTHGRYVSGLKNTCRVTTAETRKLSDETELAYSRNGIRFIYCFKDLPEKLAQRLLRLEKHRNILLCADDPYENIGKLKMILGAVAQAKESGGRIRLKNVYVTGGNVVSDELIRSIYDNPEKAGIPLKDPGFELKLINPGQTAADKILEQYPIYKNRSEETPNVHLAIVGFGELGQQFLLRAWEQAVLAPDSLIRVDVFDKCVSQNIGGFLKRFSADILREGNFKEIEGDHPHYVLRIAGDMGRTFGTDGVAELHFHNADTSTLAFNRAVEDCIREMPFTYMLIALPDGELVSDAVSELGRLLPADTPLIVRTGNGENGSYAFMPNTVHTVNPDKEIFAFEALKEDEILRTAMEFNARYDAIANYIYEHDGRSPEPGALGRVPTGEEIAAAWKSKIVYDRESSIALSRHQAVKRWLVEEQGLSPEADKEFLQRVEHRRWNLFMIANGYSYAPGKKDRVLKKHPCLSTWENLKREKPDVLEYDIIPYLMLEEEAAGNRQ